MGLRRMSKAYAAPQHRLFALQKNGDKPDGLRKLLKTPPSRRVANANNSL
jgi:hypothetical protein